MNISAPVRQTVYKKVDATECVPLIGDLEYASYQSSAPRRSVTLQQSGSYNAETRSEEASAETVLISEQIEPEQHGSLPSSSLLQGTHWDTLLIIITKCEIWL